MADDGEPRSTVWLEERVEDGFPLPPPSHKLKWDATFARSGGWSGTFVTHEIDAIEAHTLWVSVSSPPSKWSNELHVVDGASTNWRTHQVSAFLDSGAIYGAYGEFITQTESRWDAEEDVAGVIVTPNNDQDDDNNFRKITISFFLSNSNNIVFSHSISLSSPTYRLSLRVHPHGALSLL